jgi:hypothetical protein
MNLVWVSFSSTYLGLNQRVLPRIAQGVLQDSVQPSFRSGILRLNRIREQSYGFFSSLKWDERAIAA